MCSMLERLDELELQQRRLSAERARLLDEVEAAGLHTADGFTSLRSWLTFRYQLSGAEARGRMHERAAVAVHEIREVLEAGEVSVCAARELGRAASNPRCGDQLADVAETMVEVAREQRHLDLRSVVRHWERHADADGPSPDPEMQHARRSLRLRQDLDGAFHLTGRFANAQGVVLEELLDRFGQLELRVDQDQVRDEPTGTLLPRTWAQRDADALVNALTRAAATSTDAKAPEPLVNVVVDQETFERHLMRELTDDVADPIDPRSFAERTCRTRQDSWVDPRELPALALLGHVRRVVLNSAGVVVDLGRRQRLFTGAARDAVELAAPRCTHAGCGVRAHHADIDHHRPWAQGGPTDQVNGRPKCGRHHRLQDHGWRTWRDPSGTWHTVRPDGTEVAPFRPPSRAGPDRT